MHVLPRFGVVQLCTVVRVTAWTMMRSVLCQWGVKKGQNTVVPGMQNCGRMKEEEEEGGRLPKFDASNHEQWRRGKYAVVRKRFFEAWSACRFNSRYEFHVI